MGGRRSGEGRNQEKKINKGRNGRRNTVILFGAVKSAWEEVGAQEEPGKPRPSLRLSSLVRGGLHVPLTSGDIRLPGSHVAAWDWRGPGEG